MSDENNGPPVPEDQNQGTGNDPQGENIPDWMKDAGWEPSSGTFDESKPVFDDLEDEDEIVPADIPAWLEEAAPDGFNFGAEDEELAQNDDTQTESEPFEADDLDFGVPDQAPQPPVQSAEEKAEPEESTENLDIPNWLENLELDEDSQETAVAWLENMPESLRATEEEIEAAKEFPTDEPESLEEPVDELAWMDDLDEKTDQTLSVDEEASLSEDLVASQLIPESEDPEQIFQPEEIQSAEEDIPSWLQELGSDEEQIDPAILPEESLPTDQVPDVGSQESMVPDWLDELEQPDDQAAQEPPPEYSDFDESQSAPDTEDEIPDWLGDLDKGDTETGEQPLETLQWLDSLGEQDSDSATQAPQEMSSETLLPDSQPVEESAEESPDQEPAAPADDIKEHISPNDDTLNAQVPDWLSKIGDGKEQLDDDIQQPAEFQPEDATPIESQEEDSDSEFDESASWLDQISEAPSDEEGLESGMPDHEVSDWLNAMTDEDQPDEDTSLDDLRGSLTEEIDDQVEATDLDTAEHLHDHESEQMEAKEQEIISESADVDDDLPDWLSELRDEDEQSLNLEDAIRRSEHELNEAEKDFLDRTDERKVENEDWLSKLDEIDEQTESVEPSQIEESDTEAEDEIAGGMLGRLQEQAPESEGVPDQQDIPQWLEDLKTEEDPQETAVLWLQEFINKGDQTNIKAEIRRYTDELDPGDSIPDWMEDLKNEEDPQTTAMLWLEKLSGERADRDQSRPPQTTQSEDDQSDWLAELEKEEAGQMESPPADDAKEFDQDSAGWLADLNSDEEFEPEDEQSDRQSTPDEDEIASDDSEPPWMKATSPLEGEIYTDELAGEEGEPEIPAWLAGYEEGEGPAAEGTAHENDVAEPSTEKQDDQEYAWLSADDVPKKARTPLDLNKAAISQLETILGISYQVAKGIVKFRDKQGPYRTFEDLMKVPEIVDEQTIEILKPEVFISVEDLPEAEIQPEKAVPAENDSEREIDLEPEQKKEVPPAGEDRQPEPKESKKPKAKESAQDMLEEARTLLADSNLDDALEYYGKLVDKKKGLDDVIEDLKKASLDHPLEIGILKTLGDAYMESDMLDEALESYSKAEDLLG